MNPVTQYVKLAAISGETVNANEVMLAVDKHEFLVLVMRSDEDEGKFYVTTFSKINLDYRWKPMFEGGIQDCFKYVDNKFAETV